ncbi:hypothetical protein GGX14DRAFT_654413 [Mycena pura]|uniref:Uncharacterized protein n=1 Tax=Mycena pura TaxID=153505 RepID=A0AAD6V4D5_9AGAR|nr:hypothetical protein GGX14DRAFT_654413 [Mycena pura]
MSCNVAYRGNIIKFTFSMSASFPINLSRTCTWDLGVPRFRGIIRSSAGCNLHPCGRPFFTAEEERRTYLRERRPDSFAKTLSRLTSELEFTRFSLGSVATRAVLGVQTPWAPPTHNCWNHRTLCSITVPHKRRSGHRTRRRASCGWGSRARIEALAIGSRLLRDQVQVVAITAGRDIGCAAASLRLRSRTRSDIDELRRRLSLMLIFRIVHSLADEKSRNDDCDIRDYLISAPDSRILSLQYLIWPVKGYRKMWRRTASGSCYGSDSEPEPSELKLSQREQISGSACQRHHVSGGVIPQRSGAPKFEVEFVTATSCISAVNEWVLRTGRRVIRDSIVYVKSSQQHVTQNYRRSDKLFMAMEMSDNVHNDMIVVALQCQNSDPKNAWIRKTCTLSWNPKLSAPARRERKIEH